MTARTFPYRIAAYQHALPKWHVVEKLLMFFFLVLTWLPDAAQSASRNMDSSGAVVDALAASDQRV